MKEQYITCETATLLYKAGFNVPCTVYYEYDRKKNEHYQRITSVQTNYNTDGWAQGVYPCCIYSCPSQAVAARWLRERHELHVYCYMDYVDTAFRYTIQCFTDEQHYENTFSDDSYDTYEEAMEAGLQEALGFLNQ